MKSYHSQHLFVGLRQFGLSRVCNYGPKGFHGSHGSGKAELSRMRVVQHGGLGHNRSDKVVCQQVGPDLFANHFRSLATQNVHVHHGFQRTEIDFNLPIIMPPKKIAFIELAMLSPALG